jgi:succinate dehydrogenase / fumarate reductase membrane anchor subunit
MTTINKNSMRSKISIVKGSGSAKNGTSTWWNQRISSLALIPLVIWFVILTVNIFQSDGFRVKEVLLSPLNSVLLILFITMGLYHSSIGMKEIIEDYVHCKKMKYFLIISLNFVSIFTGLFGVIAILMCHFTSFAGN